MDNISYGDFLNYTQTDVSLLLIFLKNVALFKSSLNYVVIY